MVWIASILFIGLLMYLSYKYIEHEMDKIDFTGWDDESLI